MGPVIDIGIKCHFMYENKQWEHRAILKDKATNLAKIQGPPENIWILSVLLLRAFNQITMHIQGIWSFYDSYCEVCHNPALNA